MTDLLCANLIFEPIKGVAAIRTYSKNDIQADIDNSKGGKE